MKKIKLLALTTLSCLSLGLSGCRLSFNRDGNIDSGGETEKEDVAVTGLSLSAKTAEVYVGKTFTLTPTISPNNATNTNVNWTSSNTSVATVSNGLITGVKAGTCTVTATSVSNKNVSATCNVTVKEASTTKNAKWTILIYMCGSDLESENGLATSDLDEIASVSGQTSDYNVVIEAGGASSWASTYSYVINKNYLNRFHLSNKKFVKDAQISKASMAQSATLQSFLEWGISTYPADKYGVILWNHGGGMQGVCFDENYAYDSLLNNEVVTAVKGARNSLGIADKFEFIGYDACLMGLQDVAEFNAPYFNYMASSQESENGYGWDYDTWLDDLFAGKDTKTILKAVADGFIEDNGGVDAYGGYDDERTYYPADQTFSYYDLSKMDAYRTAWENMAAQLKNKITTSNCKNFNRIIAKTKYFAEEDYASYCEFDAYHFVTLLEKDATFNPGITYTTAVKNALNDLVVYNITQNEAAHDAYGISFYYVAGTDGSQKYFAKSTYSNFTNWTYLSANFGSDISSIYAY